MSYTLSGPYGWNLSSSVLKRRSGRAGREGERETACPAGPAGHAGGFKFETSDARAVRGRMFLQDPSQPRLTGAAGRLRLLSESGLQVWTPSRKLSTDRAAVTRSCSHHSMICDDTIGSPAADNATQGWQGRSGALDGAPRPAPPGEISAPRPRAPPHRRARSSRPGHPVARAVPRSGLALPGSVQVTTEQSVLDSLA